MNNVQIGTTASFKDIYGNSDTGRIIKINGNLITITFTRRGHVYAKTWHISKLVS